MCINIAFGTDSVITYHLASFCKFAKSFWVFTVHYHFVKKTVFTEMYAGSLILQATNLSMHYYLFIQSSCKLNWWLHHTQFEPLLNIVCWLLVTNVCYSMPDFIKICELGFSQWCWWRLILHEGTTAVPQNNGHYRPINTT